MMRLRYNMSEIKQSVLNKWNRGDLDDLDRNDLIDLTAYFELPDQGIIIDDEDEWVYGDDEEEEAEV
jgi:hypothetical protein